MENEWTGRAERDTGNDLALIDGAPQDGVSAHTHAGQSHVHILAEDT